jgi:hypothetical protein
MNCEPIRELLEAYVLDAVSLNERNLIEAHLAECAECQRIERDYQNILARLPQTLAAVSQMYPPTSIKTRLLESVQNRPIKTVYPDHKSQDLPHHSFMSRPRWSGWWRMLGLTAAIVLIVSLAWNVHLNSVLAQEQVLRERLSSIIGQQEIIFEIVDSDKAQKVLLRPPVKTGSSAPPYGKVFTHPDFPHVVVMAARLPQPPSGQAYHLWLTRDGTPKLVGAIKINEQGFGALVFDEDTDGPVYELAQIILQAEDTAAPSGDPVLIWKK